MGTSAPVYRGTVTPAANVTLSTDPLDLVVSSYGTNSDSITI